MQHLVHSSSGMKLVKKLAEEGKLIFTSKEAREIAHSLSINANYIYEALHYLAAEGWVINLRKGLYAVSSLVPSVSPLHEFEIAMALAKPAAISHWSALNYHGLTEQSPRYVFVLTHTGSAPRAQKKDGHNSKGYIVNGITYKFIQVKSTLFFGTEEIWINESKVLITDIERTLLDCLMSPQYCGGFSEVIAVFENHISKVYLDKIITYALKLDAVTIKRLGLILEMQGIDLARLSPLQNFPIKGYRLLNPQGKSHGKCNKNWMIQVNF